MANDVKYPSPTSVERALRSILSNVKMITLTELRVDHAHYQREDRERQAQEIAANFHAPSFGIIDVSFRSDGFYYIIDGQVRVHALRLMGVRQAPCLVSETPDVVDEAQAFLGLNVSRSPVVKSETFQAHVTSRSPLHLHIQEVLATHSMVVGKRTSELQRRVACVGALEDIAKTELLERVIHFTVHGWDGLLGSLTAVQLRGIQRFLLMHKEEFEDVRLIRTMRATSPQEVHKRAYDLQDGWHGALPLNIARVLTLDYNKNLVSERRLKTPWLTGQEEP